MSNVRRMRGTVMQFRHPWLLAGWLGCLVLGNLNCSQSGHDVVPGTQDGGGPDSPRTATGGQRTGGTTGLGGTTDQGGHASGGTSGGGGAAGASLGGAGAGGALQTGGMRGTDSGMLATGGSTATGGTTAASGGSAGQDAANATGGKAGSGGAAGTSDAGAADLRVSDGFVADGSDRDTGTAPDTRDVAFPDLAPADTGSDNRPMDDAGATTCNLSGAATSKTPTVYVVGDSTASIYTSDLYPRMGWAQPLQDFFAAACATIADKALSGRSSKSFYDEGNWKPIQSALRAGDYVLVQFGHNDEKTDDAARGTDPFTTFQKYLSIYIDETQAKGATPILLTPINRNGWSGTTLKDSHGDYPVAMRQLAQTKKISLVDMTALTKTYFERIGETATTALFMDLAAGAFPNYPSGNTDNTHLQEKGARTIAQMVLADLYRQALAPGTLAKTVPQAP
jgi:lysophospholipase L1-like esterase